MTARGVLRDAGGQLIRYAVVGLGSNALLYLFYLWLSSGGLGHKTSMTIAFALGICGTFMFNRNWSFRHRDAWHRTFLPYAAVYGLGYVTNLLGLFLLVDVGRLPHQVVQAVMIVVVAVLIFLMQKFWVFGSPVASTQPKEDAGQ